LHGAPEAVMTEKARPEARRRLPRDETPARRGRALDDLHCVNAAVHGTHDATDIAPNVGNDFEGKGVVAAGASRDGGAGSE
tara:strand:+ start:9331 stop:9573 length:243 start_codon:yes stop_codon:yes gene_type:complete